MVSKLDSLRELSTVVADTGEIEQIRHYRPTDCTTNPSLLLKAAQMPEYAGVVDEAINAVGARSAGDVDAVTERLAVTFGAKLLDLVPGYVSTECDADLSFDVEGSVRKAHRFIELYDKMGADSSRVLIKVASTWEGMQAAERLQKDGIKTNMTLMFGFAQARAAADAGAFLVSPFVGRIRDWYSKQGYTDFDDETDPGVKSVQRIFRYYKGHGYKTVIMGASFRTLGEIEALAGCDRLTISPKFLGQLAEETGPVQRRLDPANPGDVEPLSPVDEKTFRWELNEDPMATEKLAEGIRAFNTDLGKLKQELARRIEAGQAA